ncbi:MAG: hypothetical protein EA409_00050 [Saprospirales bacterium]|nr:MAG: hypothetical protein EA409_00050 [Saprospirales bacterium]
MKNHLHYIALLCFAILMVSCQKEQVAEEVTLPNSTVQAAERCIPRCEDCPTLTHCCCEVRIIEADNSEVWFCGDFLGCGTIIPTCNKDGTFTCPPINGFLIIDSVNINDILLLCIPQNEAFIIRNYSGQTLGIEIECLQGSGPPIVIPLSIGDEFVTIEVNGNCIPEQCD